MNMYIEYYIYLDFVETQKLDIRSPTFFRAFRIAFGLATRLDMARYLGYGVGNSDFGGLSERESTLTVIAFEGKKQERSRGDTFFG